MATPGARSTVFVIDTPVPSATKKYQCETCNLTTIYRRSMYKHQIAHFGKKLYKCKFCKKGFTRAYNCKQHVSAVHKNSKPFFSCPDCDYTSKWKKNLTQHRRAKHSVVKPFACPHCYFTTAYSASLRNHICRHTGEKKHTCPHCKYACIMSGNLKNHIMAKHTWEKRHKCPQCDYDCVQKCNLKRHIKKRHSGVQPKSSSVSTAEECVAAPEWQVSTNKFLAELEAIISVSQEPAFSCADCGQGFLTKASLFVHVQTH